MRGKHYSRQRVQKQRQRRRRYPFDDYTMMCQLFKCEYFKRLDILTQQLHPYLKEDCQNLRKSTGIFLTGQACATIKKQWLYTIIGEAIRPDEDGESPLSVSKNVFFRYLADEHHSNLDVSENVLKASVNKALS